MESIDFGQYLKGVRKGKKLTVRQLDLYSGVSHSYISQMEAGKRGIPSPDILKKLAKPLGVDYEELMMKAGYFNNEENKFDDLLYKAFKFTFNYIQDIEYGSKIKKYLLESDKDPTFQTGVKALFELENIDDFYNSLEFSDKIGLLHHVFDMMISTNGGVSNKEELEVNEKIYSKYNNLSGKKREMVDNMIDMLYTDQ